MRLKSFLAAALVLFLPLGVMAEETGYTVDTDYRVITPPLAVDKVPGKVQVLELFWYGCPHCNDLDPSLQAWVKSKPGYVHFQRMPAVFTRVNQDGSPNIWFIHAKAFYAAEALGVGEKIHDAFFHAIHKEARGLRTEDELANFFAEHGVSPSDFHAAFNSFAVETKVAHAMEITKRSGITGVPAIIVDGRYQVLGKRATSYDDYLKIADFLIARVRGK